MAKPEIDRLIEGLDLIRDRVAQINYCEDYIWVEFDDEGITSAQQGQLSKLGWYDVGADSACFSGL